MSRIAMFVFNDGNHDQRVHKQAQALGWRGHEVRVYCFLTPGQKPREKRDGYLLLREDQRTHGARFFDDQIMGRIFPRKKTSVKTEQKVELPPDRPPVRPCPMPVVELQERALPDQKQHWRYIERINGVWVERAADWKPDLVQAHDLDALRAAVTLAEQLDVPVIYDTHELWSGQAFIDSREAVEYWDALERELIAKTDAVLTVNEPLAEILKERFSLDEVMALHNCQESQPVPTRKPNAKPVALYQGAYIPHRGLEQVIAAAALTEKVQIALRGFGSSEPELRALDREGRVQWWEPVPGPRVVEAASQADIGLIPFLPVCLNKYYSTPNKLFEYMSAGLAIAGSDIPEIARFVNEHQIGELFDPFSPSDIARALDTIVDSGRLQEMQTRARAATESRWNWEEQIAPYLELVDSLLK
ncbi:MAG: glycosyltransferase [Vulcanimicrobiota bacterium]